MFSSHGVMAICMATVLGASTGAALAQSGTTDGAPYSVGAVFEAALALSPEAQSHKKRIEALTAKRDASAAWTAQPLSVEGSYRSDRNYRNQGLREMELGVSAPLWNWNERSRNQSLRDSELESSNAQFESTKLDLAGEVRLLIWTTLSAQVDVEIAQTRAQSAQKLVVDVGRRVEAGELAKTDLYQTQAHQAQIRMELGRATAVLSDMAAEFSAITGLPLSVIRGIQAESPNPPEGLGPLDHPRLRAIQAQSRTISQQAELTLTQRRANPELGLAVISDRSAFGVGSEKSLVLSTRIPLGNPSEYQSRVSEAQANQMATQAALKRTERSILTKERAAHSNLDVFTQLLKSASEQAELAQRVFALYQKSFELGETDLPTLLRYEQQAVEAERLARKSEIEHASRVSAYRQALGHLPE